MRPGLNLAREPFVNRRPVRRAGALLALAAAALLSVNVWLYWRNFSGRGEQRAQLEELATLATQERAALEKALAKLEVYDIDWQEDQIGFLNARIAERTFSWSALFDDLAAVLPRTVRIERVTPSLAARRRGSARSAGDEVGLEITGAAEEDESLLELLDAFFAHERFRRPSLKVEAREGGSGQVAFSMSVVYVPRLSEREEPRAAVDGAAEEPREAAATLRRGGPTSEPEAAP